MTNGSRFGSGRYKTHTDPDPQHWFIRYPILVINTDVEPCEQDILARKFVEHGEYEKAYYGTSIQAIRAVVSSEKICVLNLHPQARRGLFSVDSWKLFSFFPF